MSSNLETRVDRLSLTVMPYAVTAALRHVQRRELAGWCSILNGELPPALAPEDTKAMRVWYDYVAERWGEKIREEDADLLISVATMREGFQNMRLADSSAAITALAQWARRTRAAGRDADAELSRLRDRLRAYYAGEPGEGWVANG
jgi:hypothetical protein